ncbi:hypothetical protein BH09BAC6_BH09BAC6_12210 [soil metagenome]|jgi:hypothetical protein
MAIFELFSSRQKALKGGVSDILNYDILPETLRVQIIHIMNDAFGTSYNNYHPEQAFKKIHDILCREYGLFNLNGRRVYQERVAEFMLQESKVERVIDAIEVVFKYIDRVIREDWTYKQNTTRELNEDQAISELNERFKKHAIGYQYESGEIIKVNSTYIHSQIVKPALQLLHNKKFSGANEEYLKAHEHYRHGRNKECLTECLKSFESTMKIICKAKGWGYDDKDTSSILIKTCFENNLIPSFLQSQLSSLRSLLESGIPTLRNRLGGHGQGANLTLVDDQTTRYTLNLTGSNIIFLIESSGI